MIFNQTVNKLIYIYHFFYNLITVLLIKNKVSLRMYIYNISKLIKNQPKKRRARSEDRSKVQKNNCMSIDNNDYYINDDIPKIWLW